jgi:hypothetical protein
MRRLGVIGIPSLKIAAVWGICAHALIIASHIENISVHPASKGHPRCKPYVNGSGNNAKKREQ